jgi:hypothetical protein
MNTFDSSFSYKYLEHIPYRLKYIKHKRAKTYNSISFDFRYKSYNVGKLRKLKQFKSIINLKLTKYFIIICKHHYFYKFGPKLTGICTRRMTQLKREAYSNKKVEKRCCNNLIVMPTDEWNLSPNKKFNVARSLFVNLLVKKL